MTVALAAWPAPAAAAQPGAVMGAPDSAAVPPDSVVAPAAAARTPGGSDGAAGPAASDSAPTVRPDSTARSALAPPARPRRTLAAEQPFSSPRWVMLRSAVIPGWGQAYNRAWWKAGGIATVEIWLASRIYDDNRALDDLDARARAAEQAGDDALQNALALQYNDRLDSMVARQWLLGGVIVYALLDAYVDAHFRGFDIEFKTDPALPGGKPASAGARAGLRWTF